MRLGRHWLTGAGWGLTIGFVAALILPRGSSLAVDAAWPIRFEYWMLLAAAAPVLLAAGSPRLAADASGALFGLTAVLRLVYGDGPVGCGNNTLPACIGRTPNDWLAVTTVLFALAVSLFVVAWRRWPPGGRPRFPARRQWGELRAALLVAFGGGAILLGSFAVWDTCPKMPCEGAFGLFAFLPRSGVGIGVGVVTAAAGLLLVLVGLTASRRGGRSPFRAEAAGVGALAILAVAGYLVRTYLAPEFLTDGPDVGPVLVVGGGLLAAVASIGLRPPDSGTHAWWQTRRAPTALLIIGIVVWVLALRGHLGLRIEPLTYAVVLVALGIGLWPARLPMTRVKPVTIGLLIILYGALSLALILLGDLAIGLLEAMPLVVLAGLILLNVLELPIRTTTPASAVERIDAALVAIRSPIGLMIAALLLTGLTSVLIGVRIVLATAPLP